MSFGRPSYWIVGRQAHELIGLSNPTHTSQSIFETFTQDNNFWCFNGCGHDVGINSTFVQVAQIPEPPVFAFLGLGLAIGALSRRWRVPGVVADSALSPEVSQT